MTTERGNGAVCSCSARRRQDFVARRLAYGLLGRRTDGSRWCSSTSRTPTRTSSGATGRARRRVRAPGRRLLRVLQARATTPTALRLHHRRDQPRQPEQDLRRADDARRGGQARRRSRDPAHLRDGRRRDVLRPSEPPPHRHDEHGRPLAGHRRLRPPAAVRLRRRSAGVRHARRSATYLDARRGPPT